VWPHGHGRAAPSERCDRSFGVGVGWWLRFFSVRAWSRPNDERAKISIDSSIYSGLFKIKFKIKRIPHYVRTVDCVCRVITIPLCRNFWRAAHWLKNPPNDGGKAALAFVIVALDHEHFHLENPP